MPQNYAPTPASQFTSAPTASIPHATSLSTSAPATTPLSVPDVSNLFQSLVKSGFIPPAASGDTPDVSKVPESSPPVIQAEVQDSEKPYQSLIFDAAVRLTNADITRYDGQSPITFFSLNGGFRNRPNIAQIMYGRLASQCGQCGVRFSDTASGKQKMQDHLDTHFRQNHKATQSIGRGHSRCWFVSVEVCGCQCDCFRVVCGLSLFRTGYMPYR